MHPSHIMTQREIIRNSLNKSDWEITKDKCDSTRAHRRHLAANGKHENKRKIYCTNVHLRIIEILITLMYKLSAVTAAVTLSQRKKKKARVRPGRSVPLGYGGMFTGVFILFAARELQRLAPALRFSLCLTIYCFLTSEGQRALLCR